MLKPLSALLACLLVAGIVSADDESDPYKKFSGTYSIYGGELGAPQAPTPQDKKIAFSINGKAAKELFDALGPDKYDACTESSGTRMRWRDDQKLSCSRSKEGEYACSFGFDLRTGKSIGGSVC
ncbi:hypothetical protein [Massilia niastensis]|uniref:hypothetical protein n=1 Tax=Massilia niastensis TaxID=544911 RepID=UPI0012EBCAD2|nr:hypothetical protein [Massilia niastensis]